MRNIYDAGRDPTSVGDAAVEDGSIATNGSGSGVVGIENRKALAEQLLKEMAAWSPRDRLGAFSKWHRGALSLIHLNVLSVLEAEGPLPMNRLADALDVSDASATGIVDRLERRGLVSRSHDVADRRLVLVAATDAAAQVFSEVQEHRFDRLRKLIDRLSEEELSGLLVGIRALHRARQELTSAEEAEADLPTGEPHSGAAHIPDPALPASRPTD